MLTSGDLTVGSRAEPSGGEMTLFSEGVAAGTVGVEGGRVGACRDCKNGGRILEEGEDAKGVGRTGEIGIGGTKEDWATTLWSGANTEDVSMATTVELNKVKKHVVLCLISVENRN